MERYRLTRCALIESYLKRRFVYGRWDQEFTAWSTASGERLINSVVPSWPILTRDGGAALVAPCPDDDSTARNAPWTADSELACQSNDGLAGLAAQRINELCPEAIAAKNLYVALIPKATRAIAAQFGRFQWLVLEAIRLDRGFEPFIRTSLETDTASFVTSCWAAAGAWHLPSKERRQLNDAIMHEKRTTLLGRLLREHVGSTFIRLVRKFPIDEPDLCTLQLLLKLNHDRPNSPGLNNAPHLSRLIVRRMNEIPDWLAIPSVIEIIRETLQQNPELEILSIIPKFVMEAQESDRVRLRAILRNAKTDHDHYAALERFRQRRARRIPFPNPPYVGSNTLIPLDSASALLAEGRRMRHCVGNMVESVIAGSTYYYSWRGAEQATVEIGRFRSQLWSRMKAYGYRNAPVSLLTLRDILTDLAGHCTESPGTSSMNVKMTSAKFALP